MHRRRARRDVPRLGARAARADLRRRPSRAQTTGDRSPDFAGTAQSHRGRGLATLAKVVSTRAAQEAGIETIVTENDVANAAMLAINTKLGFRPGPELVEYAKDL
jgi:RimJ/RimL family protein N-acetyltransferase